MTSIADQVAALPLKWDDEGRLRVLMVTSRDSGRWVMPKGWSMEGREPWRAAEIEAMEEAGVAGQVSHEPIGDYSYTKMRSDGTQVRCNVTLFPLMVDTVKRHWKERGQRQRRWFSVKGAAQAVSEPDLVAILGELKDKPRKHPALCALKRAS